MSKGYNFYNIKDIQPGDSINKYLLKLHGSDPIEGLDVESFRGVENLRKVRTSP
ncbi:hypothetical protein [Atlantibacter sp.]|uniref:hypothetical protein n=1 Tax=Atlantibacter sp. TaxID=1903473 RepID=UPI0028AAA612|nr:hypothetical protein [Atlantibacter sp.]